MKTEPTLPSLLDVADTVPVVFLWGRKVHFTDSPYNERWVARWEGSDGWKFEGHGAIFDDALAALERVIFNHYKPWHVV